jgi:hypothetical protein
MALYVRKIELGKWESPDSCLPKLRADAIADIRTYEDALSVWMIEDQKNIDDAVLALAMSTKATSIDRIRVVLFSEGEVDGFEIVSSKGDTAVASLSEFHRDISGLTYETLGKIASIILKKVIDEKYVTITKAKIKEIIRNARENNKIDETKLAVRMKEEIRNL